MAFRQVARATERVDVAWPGGLRAASVVETDAQEIGAFLQRAGHPLRPECVADGLEGAVLYVTRLFEHHRSDRNYALALQSSTLVRAARAGGVVGVCLVGGGGDSGRAFGVYDVHVDPAWRNQGIGTRMLQRAMSVLASQGVAQFHLWREDDARAAALYERMGFRPTGRVE